VLVEVDLVKKWERCWNILCVGALCQLMMGVSGLCNFIKPRILWEGDGFRLMNFHLDSCGTAVLQALMVFLMLFWNVLVGSRGRAAMLLLSRKDWILSL
jgi:hypothetical protein